MMNTRQSINELLDCLDEQQLEQVYTFMKSMYGCTERQAANVREHIAQALDQLTEQQLQQVDMFAAFVHDCCNDWDDEDALVVHVHIHCGQRRIQWT